MTQEDLVVEAMDMLDKHEGEFSEWEQEFILDLESSYAKYGRLTDKQEAKLKEVMNGIGY